MASFETSTDIRLATGEAVSLDDIRGATLRVRSGTVWITQEREPLDVVLRGGDNWTVERDGRTVIEAHDEVHLRVVGRPVKPAPEPHVRRREGDWSDWLARAFSLTPSRPVPYFFVRG